MTCIDAAVAALIYASGRRLRLISFTGEVRHNSPSRLERRHPLLQIEEVEPLGALEPRLAPICLGRCWSRRRAGGEVVGVGVVDGELENGDVVVEG